MNSTKKDCILGRQNMNINYVDKEVQLKLCNLFLIPKKKDIYRYLVKKRINK